MGFADEARADFAKFEQKRQARVQAERRARAEAAKKRRQAGAHVPANTRTSEGGRYPLTVSDRRLDAAMPSGTYIFEGARPIITDYPESIPTDPLSQARQKAGMERYIALNPPAAQAGTQAKARAEEWRERDPAREVLEPARVALKPTGKRPRTFGERVKAAAGRGLEQYLTGSAVASRDVHALAEAQGRAQQFAPSDQYQRLMRTKTASQFFGELAKDPVGNIAELMTESFTAFAPTLARSAAVGLATGGIGAAVSTGVGSLQLEYAHTIVEGLQQSGVDTTDPAALRKAFHDETVMRPLRAKALKKGIPVAVFDALSAGLAGRLLKGSGTTTLGRKLLTGAGEIAMQGTAGGLGEAGGQWWSEGRLTSVPGVLAEVVAEIPGGIVETGMGTLWHRAPPAPATTPRDMTPDMRGLLGLPAQEVAGVRGVREALARAGVTPAIPVVSGTDSVQDRSVTPDVSGTASPVPPGATGEGEAVSRVGQRVLAGAKGEIKRPGVLVGEERRGRVRWGQVLLEGEETPRRFLMTTLRFFEPETPAAAPAQGIVPSAPAVGGRGSAVVPPPISEALRPSGGQGTAPVGVVTVPRAVAETQEIPVGTSPIIPQVKMVLGRSDVARTIPKTEAGVRFAVMEAGAVIPSHRTDFAPDPRHPAGWQERDRAAQFSQAQVRQIAAAPDPRRLGEGEGQANSGAPIVDAAGRVIAGNGRTIGLQLAYQQGTADDYRAWLTNNAASFGLDPADVAELQAPVLVRVTDLAEDAIPGFARDADVTATMTKSATEKATGDAARMTPALLQLYVPNDEGSVNTAANRGFRQAFMSTMDPAESRELVQADGTFNQAGVKRLRDALFFRAYGDKGLSELAAEATEATGKNLLNALMASAPRFSEQRAAMDAGALKEGDLDGELVEAVRMFLYLKREGRSVGEHLQQGTLLADDAMSPLSRELLGFFDRHHRSGKKIAEFFRAYQDSVQAQGSPQQATMFGDAPAIDRLGMARALIGRLEEQWAGGSDLFAAAGGSPATRGDAGPPNGDVVRDVSGTYSDMSGVDKSGDVLDNSNGPRYGVVPSAPAEVRARTADAMERWLARNPEVARVRELPVAERGAITDPRGVAELLADTHLAASDPSWQLSVVRESGMVPGAAGAYPAAAGDGGPGAGSRYQLHGLGITFPTARLARHGYFQLLGARVANATQAAELAMLYRDPRYETFRLLAVSDDGTIVFELALSNRLPACSMVRPAHMPAEIWMRTLQGYLDAHGASGYYLLHNHPSGNPEMSGEDLHVAHSFEDSTDLHGFRGSIVINHQRFQLLQPGKGMPTTIELGSTGNDPLLTPSLNHPLLGFTVNNPGDFLTLAHQVHTAENQVMLLYLTRRHQLRALEEIPLSVYTNERQALAWIRGRARKFGAGILTAVGMLPQYDTAAKDAYIQASLALYHGGVLLDATSFGTNAHAPDTTLLSTTGLQPFRSELGIDPTKNLLIKSQGLGQAPAAFAAARVDDGGQLAMFEGRKVYRGVDMSGTDNVQDMSVGADMSGTDNQKLAGQSASGTPSLRSNPVEGGMRAPTSYGDSSEGLQPVVDQVSTQRLPVESVMTRSTPPPSLKIPMQVGGIDVSSGDPRLIIQPTDNVEELLTLAHEAQPELDAIARRLSTIIPGLTYIRSRVKLDIARIYQKITRDKKPAHTLGDYLGGRILVENRASIEEAITELRAMGMVVEDTESNTLDQPTELGYRAYHVQLHMSNGMTAELQLVPREIADVQQHGDGHRLYELWRDDGITDAEKLVIAAQSREIFGAAWERFVSRTVQDTARTDLEKIDAAAESQVRETEQQYTFTDPKTEARFQAAKESRESWWSKVVEKAGELAAFGSRTHPLLARVGRWAEAHELLRWLGAQDGVSSRKALEVLKDITRGMTPAQYDLFTRKVILDDLKESADNAMAQGFKPPTLPFGLTPSGVWTEHARVTAAVEADQVVMGAIARRQQHWEALRRAYIETMSMVAFEVADRFSRQDYFHHMILDVAEGKAGRERKLQVNLRRAWLKKRWGTDQDISADYLGVEYKVMSQMRQDMATADVIAAIEGHYDRSPELKERAAEIRKKSGKPVDWRKLAPEGYVIWAVRDGHFNFSGYTLSQKLLQDVVEHGSQMIVINPEDLQKVKMVGGAFKEICIPEELAATLDKVLPAPEEQILPQVSRAALGSWKQLVLLSPKRLLKYNMRNSSGDTEIVLRVNPSSLTQVPRAARELLAYLRSGQPPTGDLAEWMDRGGFQGTLQAQEVGDVQELESFVQLHGKRDWRQVPGQLFRRYWRAARLTTDMREALLRYASYLDYKAQLEAGHGRPRNFGASKRDEIMRLVDVNDRAYQLANELLGAYDTISALGQEIRTHLIPFWSWTEVNVGRELQIFRNAAQDGQLAQAIGMKLPGATIRTAAVLGKWALGILGALALTHVFNYLVFKDEEDDLPEDVRNRPHIVLGRHADGTVRYFDRLGALTDFLEWFGLDNAPKDVRDVLDGRQTLGGALREMAKSPVNKVVQGIHPGWKLASELMTGRTTYPDAFEPRRIKDVPQHLANTATVGEEFTALTGRPEREGYWNNWNPLNLGTYQVDPEESAYYDVLNLKQQFLEASGEPPAHGEHQSARADVLAQLKRAARYGDQAAIDKYAREFRQAGGTLKGLRTSFRTTDPLYGLDAGEKARFVRFLKPEERRRLAQAKGYFARVRAGERAAVAAFARAK